MKTIKCGPDLIVLLAMIMLLTIPVKAEFKLINLGTLGGDTSSASAINDRGEIVGWSQTPDGMLHAFCYWNGLLRSLNSNPCTATAINDAGQIVGSSLTPSTNMLIIAPPLPPPLTNIIPPIIPPFTNPIVILPTNPIVIRHTNPIVILPTTILTLSTNTAAEEVAVTVSHQILNSSSTTNLPTMTNIFYIPHPALFRRGSLANLFPGTNSGFASGINNRSEIVGSVNMNGGPTHAFIYRNGLTTDLGNGVAASGINNRGDVVGFSSTPPQSGGYSQLISEHPFLYRHGLMHDLGTLGGSLGQATAINDLAEVVGWSTTTSNAEIHAFLYRNGKMTDLGTLGSAPSYGYGTQPYSSALAINNWGQIVGSSATANGMHAFLYRNGMMTDLNDLVTLTYVNGPVGFLTLTSARGINDLGQIVGEGVFWDGAQETTRAFLMAWYP